VAPQLALLSAVAAVTLHSALPSNDSQMSALLLSSTLALRKMTSKVALQLVKSSNPREAGDGRNARVVAIAHSFHLRFDLGAPRCVILLFASL